MAAAARWPGLLGWGAATATAAVLFVYLTLYSILYDILSMCLRHGLAPGWFEGRIPSAGVSAVVCRCFADSGAERKDVDEQKSKWIRKGAKCDQH